MDPLENLVAHLGGATQVGPDKWQAPCPAHDDDNPSLSIGRANNGGALVHCHAGCTPDAVLAALGMKLADLMPDTGKASARAPNEWKTVPGSRKNTHYYLYHDANRKLLYQVVRGTVNKKNTRTGELRQDKTFSQRRPAPDAAGKWIDNLDGVPPVLYHLPDVRQRIAKGQIVYVVEGEKDADNLRGVGLCGTTNSGGAGKWSDEHTEPLRGAHVVILPDNDEPGRDHARKVAGAVLGKAASVKIVTLPGLPDKGDVSDWLDAGGTADALRKMVDAAPLWSEPKNADVVTSAIKDGLPIVETNKRRPREISVDLKRALIAANLKKPVLFVRDGELCQVIPDENGVVGIRPVSSVMLAAHVERAVNLVSTSDKRGCVPVAPDKRHIDDLSAFLVFDEWRGIYPLKTIVTAPVLSPAGTLATEPGYHADAKFYYHQNDKRPLPDSTPTPERVAQALDRLLGKLLIDFPFVDEASRAHALCLFLAFFVRPYIEGPTPLHLIDAPVQGTGKSLLAEILCTIFVGSKAAATAIPTKDEEWPKQITTALLPGPAYVWFDNLKRPLTDPTFAQVLTAPVWKQRILGGNKDATLPVSCLWVITGNNIKLDNDFPRRSVWIRLNAHTEKPEDRDVEGFKISDIRAWIEENRPQLVSDGLTLVRAWMQAGKPLYRGQLMGSFESWCRVMGGILQVCGVPGFLENREELYEKTNPEQEQWRGFIQAWHEQHGGKAVGIADVIDLAFDCGFVNEKDRAAKNTFGRVLRSQVDRQFGKLVISAAGTANRAAQYRVSESRQNSLFPFNTPAKQKANESNESNESAQPQREGVSESTKPSEKTPVDTPQKRSAVDSSDSFDSFTERGVALTEETDNPFADDTALTHRTVQVRGEDQIEVTLRGDGWTETGMGDTFDLAVDDLRELIASPSDRDDLAPLKLAALDDALAARKEAQP